MFPPTRTEIELAKVIKDALSSKSYDNISISTIAHQRQLTLQTASPFPRTLLPLSLLSSNSSYGSLPSHLYFKFDRFWGFLFDPLVLLHTQTVKVIHSKVLLVSIAGAHTWVHKLQCGQPRCPSNPPYPQASHNFSSRVYSFP